MYLKIVVQPKRNAFDRSMASSLQTLPPTIPAPSSSATKSERNFSPKCLVTASAFTNNVREQKCVSLITVYVCFQK